MSFFSIFKTRMTDALIGRILGYTDRYLKEGCLHYCEGNDSLDKCCGCLDKRPHRTSYPAYQDGRGMRDSVKRNHFYCKRCKERTGL